MKIIVVGGGIAGLRAAKKLGATLITDQKEFVFLPRLPDSLHAGESFATKKISASYKNVVFGRVTKIDTQQKKVFVKDKKIPYDVLVLATGAKSSLSVPGASTYTLPFYSVQDVRKIREGLPAKNVLIVGAGPTGVEVAAELCGMSSVTLLQGEDIILPTFPERARAYAKKELSRLGVRVRTNEYVERVTSRAVVTTNGRFSYDMCVWCGGVRTDVPSGVPKHKGVLVDEYLRVKGVENVFAVGDCAQSGSALTAQAAVQEADCVVTNIRRLQKGRSLKKFVYRHRGDMLSLGDKAVIASHIMIKGRLASFIRNTYYTWQMRSY